MKPKQEIEDLFDKEICVECDAKCHPGSGRYVNRYPYYGDEYEGWVCGFCAEETERSANLTDNHLTSEVL